MRAVRAIAALLALAALLVGAPWALARFGNVAELLTVDWVAALTGVGGGRLMMALLSAAGWAAWLVLALTTLLEIVAVASRYRVSVTVPGTGWRGRRLRWRLNAGAGRSGSIPTSTTAPPMPSTPRWASRPSPGYGTGASWPIADPCREAVRPRRHAIVAAGSDRPAAVHPPSESGAP